MTFPPVGVTAVIAGMAVFNRDAAIVENRLRSIQREALRLEATSAGAGTGAARAFTNMAGAVTTAATVIAGAVALAGAASVKFAADFEQSLALTEALTGANADQMKQLEATIIQLSRTGTLGMTELNQAATELARAGVPIEEVMDGALKAVQELTIASGGEIGLQAAAKLVATSMNAFGIGVEDVTDITTAATVVAQNSALTFTDFGTAVQYAAPGFQAAGFKINDLALATALLGKNGVTGSVAATSLRGVIQRLIRPSADAQKVMDQYGISLFDAEGKSRTFEELLRQLHDAFSDDAVAAGKLTEEQRLQAISTLGLQRTGAAFLILANATTDELDDLRKSFDTLEASKLVEIMLRPLNAQMQIAWNNVVALSYAFGKELVKALGEPARGLVAFLQGLKEADFANLGQQVVQFGKNFFDAISNAVTQVRAFAEAFGLTAPALEFLRNALIGLAAIIATKILLAIGGMLLSFGAFLLVVGAVTTAVIKIVEAFEDAGVVFPSFGEILQGIADKLVEIGAAWAPWASQAGDAGKIVSEMLIGVSGLVQSLQFILQGNYPAAAQAAADATTHFGAAFSVVSENAQEMVTILTGWWENLKAVTEALVAFHVGRFNKFKSEMELIVTTAQNVAQFVGAAFDQLGTAVSQGLAQAGEAFNQLGTNVQQFISNVGDAFNQLGTTVRAGLDAAGAAIGGFFSAIGSTVQSGLQAIRDFFSNAWGAIPEDIRTDLGVVSSLLAQRLSEWLQTVADYVGRIIQTITSTFNLIAGQIGASMSAAGTAVSTTWAAITAATSAAVTTIQTNVSQAWTEITTFIGTTMEAIGTTISTAWSAIVTGISAYMAQILATLTEAWNNVTTAVSTALDATAAAVTAWVANVVGIIQGLASQLAAAGAEAASALIQGLVGGINAGIASVGQAAANVARAALASAKAALGAQSPSKEMEELGQDFDEGFEQGIDEKSYDVVAAAENIVDRLETTMVARLEEAKRPVRGSAASLVDDLISEMYSILDEVDQLGIDMQAKMSQIGEEVGRKINETIVEAQRDIAELIRDTNDRIAEMVDNLSQSRSDRGRRQALGSDQDARRRARRERQEDEDAAAKKTRDLADAEFQHQQDLANADNDEERARADKKYQDKIADIEREFVLDEQVRAERRKRQSEDAEFERALEKETQDLSDQLENEALQRSIKRTEEERDARIKSINEAMEAKQAKIREQGQREIDELRDNVLRKIDILEKDFAQKAVEVLRKGGEQMRPLVDNIQAILSGNFDAMRRSAQDFTTQVENAIGALARLRQAAADAAFSAPSLPSPTEGLGESFPLTSVDQYQEGGVVRGPHGKPVLAVVHAGEYIAGLNTEAARILSMLDRRGSNPANTYNLNLNASYSTYESEADVELDMRSMIAMARG